MCKAKKVTLNRRRSSKPATRAAAKKFKRVRPGSVAEAEMVHAHLSLVKHVVGRIAMTLPPHVNTEDLYSSGLVGLLNAVRNFNPGCDTAFETYARVRIRGAVLDELRRMDWVPRSVHSKARKVQSAMQQLEQAKSRPPTEAEMAKALNISPAEYEKWLEEIRPTTFICLDAATDCESEEGWTRYGSLADPKQENPLDIASRNEMTDLIMKRLQDLPEMQRKVLALYYFEDMRLREIAEVFGLTESRICQIHSQAIIALKDHLPHYDYHGA
jgi:RNA polymerase sigma factor for flagellar operon FliA